MKTNWKRLGKIAMILTITATVIGAVGSILKTIIITKANEMAS